MTSTVKIYLGSLAGLVVAVLVRWLLDPLMGNSLPLVTIFGAVAAAVSLGGVRPAILVTILGYLAAAYSFIDPRGSIDLVSTPNLVGIIAYLFTCTLIIAFGETTRRSRDEARLRREMLRVTLQSIGDAVITTDMAGRVTYLNEVAESLTGWSTADAANQPLDLVFRIVSESTRQPVPNPATRALREGVVVGLANHTLLIARDGTERPIDDSAAPIRSGAGDVTGCVLIFRDVSAQRRADRDKTTQLQAARLLAAIVESSDDAIISKSLDGIIQSWNSAAERLFGHSAAEAIGQHVSLIIPKERIAEEDDIIARLRRGERIDHFETERIRRDGRLVPVSLTISPIKNDEGQVVGASKIARNDTERKRLEDNLRQLARDLSTADRRKNEFLATLAHELRNPLAPIANMVEVLKRSPEDVPTLRQAQATIDRQLTQLVRLVDDLLDLNRITRNRLELRLDQVEIEPVIQQAIEAARPLIDASGHSLDVSIPAEPIPLRADPARLAQVFGNLLGNAAKYTPPGGAISLAVTVRDGHVSVAVRDNGDGIPADQLDAIFEMFAQIDRGPERTKEGLGIGLTLARRLIEMHGGSLVAASEGEFRGSTFTVRLPVTAAATPPMNQSDAPAERSTSSRRILVVDDNLDSAASLAMLLTLSGHETFLAHDGPEAITAAGQHRPHVVLLDIGLPKLSGLDACRRIREHPWGKDMVLIALTGWGQEEDRRKSEEAGFDGHLVKPVDYPALLELLDGLSSAGDPR